MYQRVLNDEASAKGKVLRAAALLFRERGYARTTVRDIAAAVGILSGSLFHHFPNKEAILAQLQHEAFTAKTDGARIRALELLGRHAGMFAERVEVEQVERSVSQIEAAIRQRLERLGVA